VLAISPDQLLAVLEQGWCVALQPERKRLSLERLRVDLVSTRAGESEAGGVMLG
jgi:hypothetical protein